MFMDYYKGKLKKYFEIIELLSDTSEDNEIYESVLKVLQGIINHELTRIKEEEKQSRNEQSRNGSDNEDIWLTLQESINTTTAISSNEDMSVSYVPPGAYDDILDFRV
jgi:hypothetical protein